VLFHIVSLDLKMKTKILFLFLLFSQPGRDAFAQLTLESFVATSESGKVILQWTLASGNTCNGIGIQRSEDGITFSEISFIPGICGNISSSVKYSHTDSSPLPNKKNYYRLRLGNQGFSEIAFTVFYDVGEDAYYIFPNPLQQSARIIFGEKQKSDVTFRLFDLKGKAIRAMENISGVEFIFERNDLPGGVYFFTLENSTKIFATGKLVIQ
jgi:hypothetical protein